MSKKSEISLSIISVIIVIGFVCLLSCFPYDNFIIEHKQMIYSNKILPIIFHSSRLNLDLINNHNIITLEIVETRDLTKVLYSYTRVNELHLKLKFKDEVPKLIRIKNENTILPAMIHLHIIGYNTVLSMEDSLWYELCSYIFSLF